MKQGHFALTLCFYEDVSLFFQLLFRFLVEAKHYLLILFSFENVIKQNESFQLNGYLGLGSMQTKKKMCENVMRIKTNRNFPLF